MSLSQKNEFKKVVCELKRQNKELRQSNGLYRKERDELRLELKELKAGIKALIKRDEKPSVNEKTKGLSVAELDYFHGKKKTEEA